MPRHLADPGRVARLGLAIALVLALGAAVAACARPGGPGVAPTSAVTSTPAPTTAASLAAPTTPPDPTAGWTRYSDATDRFSLRYPPTWQRRTCPAGGHTGLFLAPSTAGLAICNSGFTGQMSVAAVSGDQRSAYALSGSDLASTSLTVGGVSGTRQSATAVAADLGPPAGTRLVVYLFFTGGRTYRCAYSQEPSGPTSTNVLADFDLMVTGTLRFTA
jgi:hypothetical protein